LKFRFKERIEDKRSSYNGLDVEMYFIYDFNFRRGVRTLWHFSKYIPVYITEHDGSGNVLMNLVFRKDMTESTSNSQEKISFRARYDDTLDQYLEEYILALNGLPIDATDNFVRMLYLSAVTITTLGYGDILPITSRARLLVALEAIAGIVIIGLF